MFKLIAFDVFSALADIEGSIVPKLGKYIDFKSTDLLTFFRTWRTRQWDYLLLNNSMSEGFLNYRYITTCTLEYAFKKYNVELEDQVKEELVDCWYKLDLWPEAIEVLKEVKQKGYKIAVLSNGDEDMLQSIVDRCGIPFDFIFSADKAKAYKPSPKIYELPFVELGVSREEVLHVAGSPFDTMGAKASGLTVAWSNRFNDFTLDAKYQPDFMFNNLRGVLNIR